MQQNKEVIKERRRQGVKRYSLALTFILPFVIFFVLFTLLPLVIGIGLSFFDYNPNDPGSMQFVGLLNYSDIFGTSDETIAVTFVRPFWDSLGNTLLFCLIAVPLLIIIPLLLAYLINIHPPGYKVFRAIIYLPSIVSITVAGMMFTAIFGESSTGLINNLFGTQIQFLTETKWRWIVMIILSVWWQTGTNFVIFSAALRDVPSNLYEACDVDGGGKLHRFIHVTLPNIKGHINLCLFSTLINYLNLYGQPAVIRSNLIYDTDYDSPMMLIQNTLKTLPGWTGFICAIAVVFGLIVMGFAMLERFVMSREKGGHSYERKFAALAAINKQRKGR